MATKVATPLVLLAGSLMAEISEANDDPDPVIQEITVFGNRGTVGRPLTASEGVVTEDQTRLRPASRSAELLEFVPGLIATQHSGEGKANQYFLRGFNLDHGTDFVVQVDGLPVNMPSHAHGQGYADLNFLMPELIDLLTYRKGPHYANVGDFSAAGSAEFRYMNSVDQGVMNLTVGEYHYHRVFLADMYHVKDEHLLLAGALTQYNGPWELDQGLDTFNGLAKYSGGSDDNSWSLTAMGYDTSWIATDQIPLRTVEDNGLSRFGNIDPTSGGDSHRYSVSFAWNGLFERESLSFNTYAIDYELDLFSNFTYFLDDSIRGDQFEQFDSRMVYGFNAEYKADARVLGTESEWTIGIQGRYDDIDLGLYQSQHRHRFETTRADTVEQSSLGSYISLDQQWSNKFRSVAAIRFDHYNFDVKSDLPENSGSNSDALPSPKLTFVAGPWQRTQYFLSVSQSFHSNDARGATIKIDPRSGAAAERVPPLSKALGVELGLRSDTFTSLQLAFSIFSLELDSELVFAGDAGTTEALGATSRRGIEIGAIYALTDWLTIDGDLAYTHARFRDGAIGDHIPQSVPIAASLGFVATRFNRWSGGLRFRYLDDAPLEETNTVSSDPTLTVNAEANYQLTPDWSIQLGIYNLFDSNDNDIAYFYASRLEGENSSGVEDIHFHPVEPRAFRLTLEGSF